MDDGLRLSRDGWVMIPRPVGLYLLVVLGLHAVIAKLPYGTLPEMLYACHIATAIMAVGILLQRSELILFGFSFHLGAGFWGYCFDLFDTHTTTWTSVLAHLSPLLIGFVEVRRVGLPRWAPWASLSFLAFSVVLGYVATPNTMNVNLAHRPYPPVAAIMPGLWLTWLTNIMFGAFLIFTSHFMFRKLVLRERSVE